ncbi:MFS transporter [Pendulispora albinea]|uniref:MFS transporter n=1 Tax=Pendulispora albinea TaxID=2741071 RepID=A0ABZ2MA77_9BACT
MIPTGEAPGRKLAVFVIIWFGQVISSLGSAITSFAFGVWLFERHRSITEFGVYSFCSVVPLVVVSPFVGPLVDRWNRRTAMLVANTVAAAASFALWLLFVSEHLRPWHVFAVAAINAAMRGLQWPAYSASTTVLVPEEHYGRAAGMISVGEGISQIAAPLAAGALLGVMPLGTLVLLDGTSFLVAIVTLLAVRIPHPVSKERAGGGETFLRRMSFGWRYLRARPGLLTLQLFLTAVNLTENLVVVLIAPLVLSFADRATLGRVLTVGGLGVLSGAVAMSLWGGPRRRVRSVLVLFAIRAGVLFLAALRFDAVLIAGAAFVFLACMQLGIGTLQSVWLKKVPPAMQGRVFALRQMIATSMVPVAYLIAGPLADRIFEPLMAADGLLAASAGRWLGVGPGRGIALLFVVLGALNLALIAAASLLPRLVNVETELPDASADDPPTAAISAPQPSRV